MVFVRLASRDYPSERIDVARSIAVQLPSETPPAVVELPPPQFVAPTCRRLISCPPPPTVRHFERPAAFASEMQSAQSS